jgi:hypothetical protein
VVRATDTKAAANVVNNNTPNSFHITVAAAPIKISTPDLAIGYCDRLNDAKVAV